MQFHTELAAAAGGARIAAVAATVLELATQLAEEAFLLAAGIARITARGGLAARSGLAGCSLLAWSSTRGRLTAGGLAAVVAAMLVAEAAKKPTAIAGIFAARGGLAAVVATTATETIAETSFGHRSVRDHHGDGQQGHNTNLRHNTHLSKLLGMVSHSLFPPAAPT